MYNIDMYFSYDYHILSRRPFMSNYKKAHH